MPCVLASGSHVTLPGGGPRARPMQALRTALIHNRALAGLLVAAALLARALVPGGYMAAPSAGSITVTLCADASGTPKQVQVALGDHEVPGKDHQDKHSPCAFAGMAALADLAPLPEVPLPPPPAVAASFAVQAVAVGQGLAAPPPYQTGPPAIA